MTCKDIFDLYHTSLDSLYDSKEVDSFVFILFDAYLHMDRVDYLLDQKKKLKIEQEKTFLDALELLKNDTPIQYIVGHTHFGDIQLKVNSHVLIPRPETEEMGTEVLSLCVFNEHITNVLDIGTGSGCLSIALAKNKPKLRIFALDKYNPTLEVAKENAQLNQCSISFLHMDFLESANWDNIPMMDMIMSNPPYVRQGEKLFMKPNVLNHEPHQALFVEDSNPLIFYQAIAEFGRKKLTPKGYIYVEINEYLGKQTKKLFEEYGYNQVTLRKDLFGKDRFIYCTK